MEPLTEFLRSLGVEICADGRRRWSHDAKAYIVAETLKPGATVKAVAGKFGVNANRLSEWRGMIDPGRGTRHQGLFISTRPAVVAKTPRKSSRGSMVFSNWMDTKAIIG